MLRFFILMVTIFVSIEGQCATHPEMNCTQTQPTDKIGENVMDQPKVIVYTASYCPYCTRAKDLLKSKRVDFEEIDVTDAASRDEMIHKSHGRKTIPQIFIGDTHVGGFDDLNALNQKGELDKLLGR